MARRVDLRQRRRNAEPGAPARSVDRAVCSRSSGPALALTLGLSLSLAGCESELVNLGRSAAAGSGGAAGEPTLRLVFGELTRRAELGTEDKDDNPTLTFDTLEVFFTSTRGEGSKVYTARRSAVGEPFGEPELVAAVEDEDSSSPAISLDGLSLWVGQSRDEGSGELDIWVTTRPDRQSSFGALTNVAALNSPQKDIPRPPAGDGRVMPLSSERAGAEHDYRTFLAAREDGSSEFSAPVPLPELELGQRVVDGFLSEDLRLLFFSAGIGEFEGDLYVTERADERSAFGPAVALDALNRADSDERDPWLSPDGTRFFFTSNREADHGHEIFEVELAIARE